MRKRDPDTVVDRFVEEADMAARDVATVLDALRAGGVDIRLRQLTAQDIFLRVAVRFEVFKSDWFIAAVNREPTQFRVHLTESARKRVRSGADLKPLADHIEVRLPAHPTLSEVDDLLNPHGWNVSAATATEFKDLANSVLDGDYLLRARTIGARNQSTIDTITALRNLIVHHSPASQLRWEAAFIAATNGDLRKPQTPPTASEIPGFLHSPGSDKRRAVVLVVRMVKVAEHLRAVR